MEISTTKDLREPETPITASDADGSRYLRRKAVQKLRKSQPISRHLAGILLILGKAGFLVLIAAFLLSIFNYAYTSDNFKLRQIGFHGWQRADPRALEAIIRQSFPANILMMDLAKLRSRLETEPWVKRVEVRRILPSQLQIYLQERTPSVILEINGELMVSDDEGILLDKYDPKYGKLDVPVFKGLMGESAESYKLYQEENSSRVRLGRKMMAELESGSPTFTQSISEVDLSDKSNLKVFLVDETAEVSLGDRDFLKRFRTLVSNMPRYRELKSQYNEIASVDLRFDGQIIYRPRLER